MGLLLTHPTTLQDTPCVSRGHVFWQRVSTQVRDREETGICQKVKGIRETIGPGCQRPTSDRRRRASVKPGKVRKGRKIHFAQGCRRTFFIKVQAALVLGSPDDSSSIQDKG